MLYTRPTHWLISMVLVGEVAHLVSYLQSLWGFHESIACSCMVHALSTIPARSVINSDESFLIHLFKTGQMFTNI
jgi:hypothetical protein